MGFVEFVGAQCGNLTGVAGRMMAWGMSLMNRAQYRAAEEAVSMKRGSLLEIGFGGGYLLRRLSRKKPECRFYGVEISREMLQRGLRRNRAAVKSGRMELREGDVSGLPYEEAFFDGAYTVNTVYFWPEPEAALRELFRVLKPGGVFANVCYEKAWLERLPYTRSFRRYERKELEDLGRQAGFSEVHTRTIKQGASYVVQCKK